MLSCQTTDTKRQAQTAIRDNLVHEKSKREIKNQEAILDQSTGLFLSFHKMAIQMLKNLRAGLEWDDTSLMFLSN